ncbi:N-formyl peptide receptor 2 [Biomphalaria glabrata]|nr:N-formyl peptide receptor 2 [Biomphalaria glabrata]
MFESENATDVSLPFMTSQSPATRPDAMFVPNNVLDLLTTVIDVWINLLVCITGVATNSICVAVFCRLGFRDTVSITMTAISLWDLVKVFCGMMHRLFGPVSLLDRAMGKSWENITFTKLTYIHVISGNVSAVIAGYVAIERCLCVSLPFKVKWLLTPKLTFALTVTLSVVVFFSYFCILLIFDIHWVYSADFAAYIAVYTYNTFYKTHGQIFFKAYTWFHFIYPFLSLVAMISSTLIIAYHLMKAPKFKTYGSNLTFVSSQRIKTDQSNPSLTSGQALKEDNPMTPREKQVVKMLLVVIGVFIANQGPRFIHVFAMILVPEYYPLRLYHNLIMTVMCFVSFLDFFNASVGLFIFLKMSSKFKAAFFDVFHVKFKCETSTVKKS